MFSVVVNKRMSLYVAGEMIERYDGKIEKYSHLNINALHKQWRTRGPEIT